MPPLMPRLLEIYGEDIASIAGVPKNAQLLQFVFLLDFKLGFAHPAVQLPMLWYKCMFPYVKTHWKVINNGRYCKIVQGLLVSWSMLVLS